MAIEAEELETKVCSRCGELKSIDEFFTAWHKGRQKRYIRAECKACHGRGTREREVKLLNRRKIRKGFKEAPYLAVIRVLKDDPDLMTEVIRRHPLTLKRYLKEEQDRIFNEHKERSIKNGEPRAKYTNLERIWNELEEELKTGKLKEPHKRTLIF